jgi:hypothetical protein
MGSSFVGYRDKGFWVSDTWLQVWLHFIVIEIDSRVDQSTWLLNLRDSWYQWATIDCVGCMGIGLDEIAPDEEKMQLLLHLSEGALKRLAAYGESIPKEN